MLVKIFGALTGCLFTQLAFSGRRAHDVEHQSDGKQAIQHEGNSRSQYGAVAAGSFCHTHHDGHIKPRNWNDVHIGVDYRFVRKKASTS